MTNKQPQVLQKVPPKILIVDDEKDLADQLSYLFEIEGYEAKSVVGGREMLGTLPAFKPDIVLLDLMMPPFNGIEALTAMQEIPVCCDTPVILTSASREPKVDPKLWTAFVAKPFDIESLLAVVQTLLPAAIRA